MDQDLNRSKLYLRDDDYNDDDEDLNSHKSTNFEGTTSRFCMVKDINDTYRLYFHAKSQVYFAYKLFWFFTALAYLEGYVCS